VLVLDDEQTIRTGRDADADTRARRHRRLREAAQSILERDQDFDVILCDLMMPRKTGMELHAWLLAQHPALAARVVSLSGGEGARGCVKVLASS
jgi:DNA-binding NarL/FixJ family response regulator